MFTSSWFDVSQITFRGIIILADAILEQVEIKGSIISFILILKEHVKILKSLGSRSRLEKYYPITWILTLKNVSRAHSMPITVIIWLRKKA